MQDIYAGMLNGAVQDAYTMAPPKGAEGQIAYPAHPNLITGFPFSGFCACGRAVVFAPDNDQVHAAEPRCVELPAAQTIQNFVGLVMWHDGAANNAAGEAGIRDGMLGPVVEGGRVWARIWSDALPGGDVYVVVDANNEAGAPVGALAADPLEGKAVKCSRMVWYQGGYTGELGIVTVYAR